MAYGINSMSAKAIKTKIIRNKLFDEEYYLSLIEEDVEDALEHYLTIGYKLGLNPSRFFDTECYIENNMDVDLSDKNPLAHYVVYALNSDRKVKFDLSSNNLKKFLKLVYQEKLFDEEYYLSQCDDIKITDPLEHYIKIGSKQGLNPSCLFDTRNYLKNNIDVAKVNMNPLIHYVVYGLNSDRKVKFDLSLSNLKEFRKTVYREYLFDDEYYLANFSDSDNIVDPLDHYLTTGWKEGLNPSSLFETRCYLENNPDIKLGMDPLQHYVLYTFDLNRKVKVNLSLSEYKAFKDSVYGYGLFDDDFYLSQCYEDVYDPFTHYLNVGWKEGKDPSLFFSTSNYLDNNDDVKSSGINPLQHYVTHALGSNRKVKYDLSLDEYKNFLEVVYEEKLFNDEYYIQQCQNSILFSPIDDYLTNGWKENKNPSYRFNTEVYLSNNPDVKKSGKNPLIHFVLYSLEDNNRKFNFGLSYDEFKTFEKKVYDQGFFEDDYYLSQCDEDIEDSLGHYLTVGWKDSKNPSYIFDTNQYLEYNANEINEGMNPLLYFMLYAIDTDMKMNYDFSYDEYCEFEKTAKEMGLFDEEYYMVVNPDIRTVNPLAHYLTIGYREGRNPSPLFDTNCYLENSLDIAELGLNPLIHYVNNAYDSNRKIKCNLSLSKFNDFKSFIIEKGFFDEKYYLKQCDGHIVDSLDHYLTVGWKKNKDPSVIFSTEEYFKYNRDVVDSGMNPLLHYVLYGIEQSRIFNFGLTLEEYKNFLKVVEEEELFDEDYYLSQCDDKDIEYPFYHYLTDGYKLGYNPSENFSTVDYLTQYRDISNDGRNPLVHFCQYGLNEDRTARFNITLPEVKHFRKKVIEEELFDEDYYLSQCDEEYVKYPLEHYVEVGSKKGLNPSVFFNTNNYLENNPDVFYLNKNPLVHYVTYALDTNRKVNHNLNLKQYKKFRNYVFEEGYFDDEYYLSNFNESTTIIDPLEHYLTEGYKEGYNPSEKFNTNEYIEKYPEINNQNPLIHFILNLLDTIETISNSELFDEEFYLTHLDDYVIDDEEEVLEEETERISKYDPEDIDNPIMHYITEGAEDGLNPNAYFSSLKYLECNPDVEKSGLNPLYHYIKYGKRQSRDTYMVLSNHLQKFDKRYKIHSTSNMLKALENKVSIIIPIYNAYEETRDCITSVLRNTHIDYELILINDCSTDERIDELLDSLELLPDIKVIRNKENQGFIKNVNMGMKSTENDVVLLNSDTIVTPHWLSHIVYCAYSSNEIGTVTPFSNASDISIPEFDCKDFHAINNSAYRLDKLSYNLNMEAPTGNGFCLFIKRECIDEVGYFDESFGKGYGEETDFTFRALKQGWLNIRNDSVFIYHRRHASFKKENTDSLKAKNKKILEERYPDLYEAWDEFAHSLSLQDSLERIRLHCNDLKNPERILYVTGIENNEPILGEDYHNMADYYDTFIITLHSKQIKLGVIREGRFVLYEKWDINSKWDQNSFASLYMNILLNLKIDLVYVKYLYSYYNPNNQNISLFIRLLSKFEIRVLYEATCDKEKLPETIHEMLNPMESLEELIHRKNNEIDFNNNKLVVYTALTGNYDELVTPSVINPKFDYICFTDNPNLKSDFWTIKLMDESDLDKVRKARKYKILPHKYLKEYDYSLWIDANFDIIGDIEEYIHRYSVNNKLLAIKHDLRNDVYEEAKECIRLEKDDPDLINKQVERYVGDGYPENNGLIVSGILFRNHNNHEIITLMEEWFSEVYNYSRRDQLSFNYVCWKNDYQYDESPIFYFKNQYFQRLLHVGDNNISLKYDEESVDRILDSFKNKTSIIVPIYNAYEETKACIESVIKYTTVPYELLLINDCSTDERIGELLHSLQDNSNIRVISNDKNQGFVKNINLGFEKTSDDVVILNSDTEVTPKWLQKLKIAAYSNERIATVTPLSNNAGAFSVPIEDEDNELQPELGVLGTSNIIEKISKKDKLYVPTGNGFCMYIKREAIYSVGFFDQIFGLGYCEENDFCMRLLEKGFLHIIDPSTYVYHKHNVSFSSIKDEIYEGNRQILEEKYPDYSLKLLDMLRSYDLQDIRANIARVLESEDNKRFDTKRILYLIHEGTGGTLHTSIELMGQLPDNMESYILTAGQEEIKLFKYTNTVKTVTDTNDDDEFLQHLVLLSKWDIKSGYSIKNVFNKEFRRIYFNVLYSLKIDIVHIRHLIRHSFDMPYVAKQLGIPVILSFHDFYYVCPSHNLIDDNEEYCGGQCSEITSNNGQCDITGGLNAPILKTYVSTWRKEVSDMLNNCDAFVTTSQSAYDIYTNYYPELKEKTFAIIEHGRDITTPDKITESIPEFNANEPVKILFPGHINVNKGGWLIKAIKDCDTDNRLEFHYMGNLHSKFKLEEIGIHHGYYKRSEFCKEVSEIKPHFIGLFSIWPETYCHTLTEAWGCGVPVITLDIGALGERVHRHGGGFFIENDPQKAYDKIIEISENTGEYQEALEQILDIRFKTTKEMAEEYMRLYDNYLS